MSERPLILTGGVDLQTPAPLASPGTLRDCLNVEVSYRQGYSRIGGVARYDGSKPPDKYRIWLLRCQDTLGAFSPPNRIAPAKLVGPDVVPLDPLNPTDQSNPLFKDFGIVVSSSLDANGDTLLCTVWTDGEEGMQVPNFIISEFGSTAEVTERTTLFEPIGTQANYDAALAKLYAERRDAISHVPGRPGSDVIGGFWLKNKLYAIRDLPVVAFKEGYFTDADEGKSLQVTPIEGRDEPQWREILRVIPTGFNSGLLVVSPWITDDTNQATGIGSPELVMLDITTNYPATAPQGGAYSGSISVRGGAPPYSFSLEDDGDPPPPDSIFAPEPFEPDFRPQQGFAALWRADDGWVYQDLGREIPFINGGPAMRAFLGGLPIASGAPQDTGFVFGSSLIDAKFNGATNNNLRNDSAQVTVAAVGDTAEVYFRFESIPLDAEITGIEVEISRSSVGSSVVDEYVTLLNVTAPQNKAHHEPWESTLTSAFYGGPNDLWGAQRITAEDLDGIGVLLVVNGSSPDGEIDFIKMRVTYQLKGRPAFVHSGTEDNPITITNFQVVSGDFVDGNAAGYLFVKGVKNGLKSTLISEGDIIYTEELEGGDALCECAGRDIPVFLPGQFDIDNNASRYEHIVENFYGRNDLQAAFVVQGVGPAWSWDGANYTRIRTQLPSRFDMPRHIIRHGDLLGLGYFSGLVVFSAVPVASGAERGGPYEFRGASGAFSLEVGDRLTALVRLTGDAFAAVCAEKTFAYRGLTESTMSRSGIAANRGAIEYTAADMGRVILSDGFGLFAADSDESYGPAERSYLSLPVLPWLEPRLQATVNGEQAFLRPVKGLAVRNKNQYRLYFWDGYVLTMTIKEQPEFTFQRIADDERPWPIRFVTSGIDASGRERIFGSFFGVNHGFVYELDAGRSFDGQPIPAFVELNPVTVAGGSRLKRHDRLFMYGAVAGKHSISYSRGVDYEAPNPDIGMPFTLGDPDAVARDTPRPVRGSVDFPVEGLDVSMRFDSKTATEPPFTLQFIDLYVDDRGSSRGTVR